MKTLNVFLNQEDDVQSQLLAILTIRHQTKIGGVLETLGEIDGERVVAWERLAVATSESRWIQQEMVLESATCTQEGLTLSGKVIHYEVIGFKLNLAT